MPRFYFEGRENNVDDEGSLFATVTVVSIYQCHVIQLLNMSNPTESIKQRSLTETRQILPFLFVCDIKFNVVSSLPI
jgi:hypothetical protein